MISRAGVGTARTPPRNVVVAYSGGRSRSVSSPPSGSSHGGCQLGWAGRSNSRWPWSPCRTGWSLQPYGCVAGRTCRAFTETHAQGTRKLRAVGLSHGGAQHRCIPTRRTRPREHELRLARCAGPPEDGAPAPPARAARARKVRCACAALSLWGARLRKQGWWLSAVDSDNRDCNTGCASMGRCVAGWLTGAVAR
jgi:hypothetical protein